MRFLKAGEFSSSFVINVDAEFSKMMIGNDLLSEKISDPDSIFKTELLRLLRRSCEMDGEDKSRTQKINEFKNSLKQLQIGGRELANFISALRIIRFLDREVKYLNAY